MTDEFRRGETRPIPEPSSVPEVVAISPTNLLTMFGLIAALVLVVNYCLR